MHNLIIGGVPAMYNFVKMTHDPNPLYITDLIWRQFNGESQSIPESMLTIPESMLWNRLFGTIFNEI